MELGIFAKTFGRQSVEEVLDAVQAHGLSSMQFNMSCAGLPSMPEQIDPELAAHIGKQCERRAIRMSAVSGTFNMAHPDGRNRRQGIARLRTLAAASSELGTSIITLCTGTRDRENMWRQHPDNHSNEAWHDLMETLEAAVAIAEEFQVTLGIEPEQANIISDAQRAKRLLDEISSPNVKIVMDAANLYNPNQEISLNDVLSESFHLLGEHIVLAHAKDIAKDGESEFVAAGQGILDYGHYLKLLAEYRLFEGALILHGLQEEQVAESLSFIQARLTEVFPIKGK